METVLNRLAARAIAQLIRTREISAVEVLDSHISAIDRVNPKLNAIVTLASDEAREAARQLDQALARSPGQHDDKLLAGVPIAIKDVTATAGLRTTYGCALYKSNVPSADAEVVRRLRVAGAIVVGKTNTPEFGTGANTVNDVFGATVNPWDTRMSVGGSTGGGACALAARMIALAEGTDFGGSLRTPAAFCGVVGLRTTAGLVPRYPSALPWHDQGVAGPMARDAEDCALMLDAMLGPSLLSPISLSPPWESTFALVARADSLRGMRLAYAKDLGLTEIDPEIASVCQRAAHALEREGAEIEEITVDFSDGRDAFITLRGEAMLASHLERLDKLDLLGANLAGNIRLGLGLPVLDIARAERKRAEIWHRWRQLWERFDLLLTPTTPVAPFPVSQNYPEHVAGKRLENYIDWVAQSYLVSLAALPAASAPAGLTEHRLPVGLQIVGPRLSEPAILTCAKFVERSALVGLPPHAG